MTSSAPLTDIVVRLCRFHFFFVLGEKAGGPLDRPPYLRRIWACQGSLRGSELSLKFLLSMSSFDPRKKPLADVEFNASDRSLHPSRAGLGLLSYPLCFAPKKASIFTGSLFATTCWFVWFIKFKNKVLKSDEPFLSKPPKIRSPLSPSDSDYKSLSTILLAGLAPAGT